MSKKSQKVDVQVPEILELMITFSVFILSLWLGYLGGLYTSFQLEILLIGLCVLLKKYGPSVQIDAKRLKRFGLGVFVESNLVMAILGGMTLGNLASLHHFGMNPYLSAFFGWVYEISWPSAGIY